MRSQVIQRSLPRPYEVNLNVLRPPNEVSLTDLQKAEEMIKKEMITMMCYDAVKNPVQSGSKRTQSILNQAYNWLDHNPYEELSTEDMDAVSI